MSRIQRLIWVAVLMMLAAAPAFAMGRSEDPREKEPQPVGTDADPSIRSSDQNLKQLLFQPPAADAMSADPGTAKAGSDRPRS